MKTYRLSSNSERVAAVTVSVAFALLMALLIYALRESLLALILTALAALLVAAVLVFYVANLFRAACIPNAEEKTLFVRGFPDETLDLSGAVSVKTVPLDGGPVATRTLIFSDAAQEPVAVVPTFFTARQGAQAEPLAAALAQELGLAFLSSLEPWEYDKNARAEREKAAAQTRKEARRARLGALKAKFSPGKAAEESKPASPEETAHIEADNVNYDALDDQR